jgi:LPXTG-motif cell wall-anchored protein
MKITNLFAKGLVITTIASTLALGAGVAGVSASDGRHDRNTSGSEHERGSEHGHDDDDHDDDDHDDDDHDDDDHDGHGRGHESHGRGWGFGHGSDEHSCDDEDGSEDTSDDASDDDSAPVVTLPVSDTPVDSAPDTTVSTSGPTSEPTIETPAIVFEVPAVAAPTDFRVTNPAVVPTAEPISASPTSTSPTTASPISNSPAATIQPQIVDEVPEVAGDPTTNPSISGTVDAEATQQTAPSTSSSLPMTGASAMVLLGLAAGLLAAGWLVITGRRRNNNEVA